MWIATVKIKEELVQGIRVTVVFSNGTKTLAETVIPQDETGFRHWVKSRLASLNSIDEIGAKYAVDEAVDVTEQVVTPTADELATRAWFADFRKMVEVGKLISLGVFAGTEAPIVNLRNKLKTNFKVEYLDLM